MGEKKKEFNEFLDLEFLGDKKNSVIVSFRLTDTEDAEIDRFILRNLQKIPKGERSDVIKIALFDYFIKMK